MGENGLADRIGSVGREAVHDEVRNAAGRGRIEIRKHHDDVASLRKDLEISIHAGSATAVAEVAHRRACVVIHEAEGVFCAARCIDFSAGKQIGILCVQQPVIGQGVREA